METAIYCRVSTEEQAQEGFSIRAQEQKLKEYANVKDWSIYNIYIDEGISGKNITERPAVNRMIEDIKAGHIKNVLVFKLDRLTRSVADLVLLIDIFKQNDCAFNSLMESLDTSTASGRMFIKIIGIFAEFERENIAERVRLGCERKAREGYTNSAGCNSYGYDRAKGQKVQTINKKESAIVREIYDMYVNQNLSYSGIAKRLNMRGIPTKKKTTWGSATIKKVLTNCAYIGKVRYCVNTPERGFETDGKHEAIISEELYNEAQKLIARTPYTSVSKKPKECNYYTGFLYCEKCGAKLTTHNTYKRINDKNCDTNGYLCGRRTTKGCDAPGMTHKNVEAAFKAYMLEKYNDFSVMDKIEIETQEKSKCETAAQIQGYKDKLRHIDSKEKEVMNFYLNGDIDFESYRQMKVKLDNDSSFLKDELEKLDVYEGETEGMITREDIMTNFRENWDFLNDKEKRQFLMKFIRRIVIYNERTKGIFRGTIRIQSIEFIS